MNRCTQTNEVCCNERLCTFLQVLFESLFCLMQLLNMAVVQNVEVMSGQTLNHSV
jgi:hypothetical protein